MAKGSLNGVRKGKKGDSVYYTITGSNNKEKQGERQYIGEVANPKTMMQAAQRMKLTPAVNFYRAFGNDILNHSWQGVKYGARSHAQFMKLAMNNNAGVFPFVNKGFAKLIPGRYIISNGSLPSLRYSIWSPMEASFIPGFTLPVATTRTVAEWMALVVQYSGDYVQAGDQVTIVCVCREHITIGGNTQISDWYGRSIRLVLDPTKDGVGFNTASEYLASKGLAIDVDEHFYLITPDASRTIELGGLAVIVSRPSVSRTNGAVSWLRSRAQMIITNEVQDAYFSQNAYDEAIRTYLPENVNPSSGWYLNDGTLNPDNQQTPLAPGVVSYIRNQVVSLRAQEIFGDYALKAVCKNLRKDGMIATPKTPSSGNYAEIQLYALSQDPTEEGEGTVIYKPASLVIVAANENEMAEINDFLGDMITPDEAIVAMAEEGVTYTKGY